MGAKNQKANVGLAATKKTYSPRMSCPPQSNPCYYLSSPFKPGKITIFDWHSGRQGNCTAYAWGRFWEVSKHFGANTKLSSSGNAEDWYYGTNSGFTRGKTPQLGAIMCFADGPYSGLGHVMVVEKIKSANEIVCSESGYAAYIFQTRTLKKKSNGTWSGIDSRYKFQGFIYNPNVPKDTSLGEIIVDTSTGGSYGSYSGAVTEEEAKTYKLSIKYKTVSTKITTTSLHTYTGDLDRTKTTSLLSYPSLVETPFVIVKLDNFTFGTYTKKNLSTQEKSKYRVIYPNYVKGLQVTKVNGTVNQYTITLVHQIEPGNDPNFIDKVLGRVGYNTIKITYGDWSSPEFVYKEEEAIITKVSSNVDFGNARITYTINCTSSSLALASNTFNWAAKEKKPSDVILSMLENKKYGLTDIFYGMKDLSKKVLRSTLIASDDKVVKIPAKKAMDPLSYINFLVTCMTSVTNNNNNQAIKDSSYYMTIHDDVYGDQNLNGPYFKITKVKSNSKTIQTADTYEVDINYPSESLVTAFNINNDNSWSLLYNYSDKMSRQRNVYSIGDDGVLNTESTPNSVVSADKYKMVTESQKTWWTQMTQFPISATMTIKGLVRPAMLMTYIRVNAFFYGQRHIASGLYIVTKQQDKIDGTGYRTTLSLQRVAGDTDYFITSTKTVKSKVVDSISYVEDTSSGSGTKAKDNTKTAKEKNDTFYNETLTNILGKNNVTDIYNGKYAAKQFHKNKNLVSWYGTYSAYSKAWQKYGSKANTQNMNTKKTKQETELTLPTGQKLNVTTHKR